MPAIADRITEAYGHLVGRTIVKVRPLDAGEAQALYWSTSLNAPVGFLLVLDDDSIVIPTCDPEGNGPGALLAL